MKNQVDKILKEHNLDFQINKVPLFVEFEGKKIESPYFGLLNSQSKEIIHSVKGSYHVSQNRDVVELVLDGMKSFGDKLKVSKAGSIKGGRKIFMQLEIEGQAKVGKDILKRYVTVIDSNDGSTGLSIGTGDLTMSCQNQFYKFYKSGHKMMHTSSLSKKMNKIPEMIETSLSQSLQLIELYNKFVSTKISKKLADELMNSMIGMDRLHIPKDVSTRSLNIMNVMYSHIDKEIADKGLNLWGLHSGITSFTTHEKAKSRNQNEANESLLVGGGYMYNQKSFDFVSELV